MEALQGGTVKHSGNMMHPEVCPATQYLGGQLSPRAWGTEGTVDAPAVAGHRGYPISHPHPALGPLQPGHTV